MFHISNLKIYHQISFIYIHLFVLIYIYYLFFINIIIYLFIIPKNARCTAFGKGGHWIATFVTIPKVPSEPINKCFR